MDREQVQQGINAAFPELPVPDSRSLIPHIGNPDRRGEEKIRSELAGKRWRSLTPEFLTTRWSAFRYLSPEAYCYYLPSLLTAALQDFYDASSLLHSVVFSLRPSFWDLYYEGRDQDFLDKDAAFTERQYRAIGGFLGLVFESVPSMRHLAAQALRWGWNRINTPARDLASDYYHQLHTFSWPEPEDPEINELFHTIQSAFAATPYPGDDSLCDSNQGDEPAECAMELRGVRWQSAHPELLAQNYSALSFLTDSGFRYFVPAFMVAHLFDAESNAFPVFQLTHGLGGLDDNEEAPVEGMTDELWRREDIDWDEYARHRFSGFTQPERMAIIAYLQYQTKDDFEAPRIRRALETYWLPSVQQSAT